MHFCYIDESGDTGNSSRFFILSCVYMSETDWQSNYDSFVQFRKQLVHQYSSRFPMKMEFHTKDFLQDKKPFHGLFTPTERRTVLQSFISGMASLKLKTFSVAIDKHRLTHNTSVLDQALTFLIQRIENDLSPQNERYLLISDEGRLGEMVRIARRVRKFNFVPSQYYGQQARNRPIKGLLEDIFAKDSKQSYFLQMCDLMSYISLLNIQRYYVIPSVSWASRVRNVLMDSDIKDIYQTLSPILNTKVSMKNEDGIYFYPS